MKIVIESIPHDKQRYPTCGDWFYDADGTLQIKVSDLSDWRMSAAVAVHETVEALICKQDGVTQEAVDVFDKDFEENRESGNLDEPGDSTKAPYYKQHGIASGIERIFATELGLDWNTYATEIDSLP
jgi:hypothetical protein